MNQEPLFDPRHGVPLIEALELVAASWSRVMGVEIRVVDTSLGYVLRRVPTETKEKAA